MLSARGRKSLRNERERSTYELFRSGVGFPPDSAPVDDSFPSNEAKSTASSAFSNRLLNLPNLPASSSS